MSKEDAAVAVFFGFLFGAMLMGILLSLVQPDLSRAAIKRGWAIHNDMVYRIVPAEVK